MGERIWNLERLFNLREEFSGKDDRLPSRFSPETLHLCWNNIIDCGFGIKAGCPRKID